jgi:hypothetical protein
MAQRKHPLGVRAALATFALVSVAAACSGGDDSASDSSVGITITDDTTAATTGVTPITVESETTPAGSESATTTVTTVAGDTTTSGAGDTSTTTEAPTTTAEPAPTTTVPVPVYPLTGVPNPDPAIAARVALVVKIGNEPAARPQTGFNEADIVFEEIVNHNLTRFAMVFQSNGSDPVGPVRSGRIQDIDLFGSFNRPLFAWSGGNATVTRAIVASDLIDLNHQRNGNLYFRSRDRKSPSNLYSNTTDLWARAPFGAPPPPQQFAYRDPAAPPMGTPSVGVDVTLDAVDVEWYWNPDTALYERVMEGKPHVDRLTGDQVTTNNVVVMEMYYDPGIGSPDAQSVGWNVVHVFTGGHYIKGTWIREDRTQPWLLVAEDGVTQIRLTPGRTFIELPREGGDNVLPFGP